MSFTDKFAEFLKTLKPEDVFLYEGHKLLMSEDDTEVVSEEIPTYNLALPGFAERKYRLHSHSVGDYKGLDEFTVFAIKDSTTVIFETESQRTEFVTNCIGK